jgi:hypothetical protein
MQLEVFKVRKSVVAAAVAAVLSVSAGQAQAQGTGSASRVEFDAMQTQLQALTERLDKLEATNAQLKTENDELKAVVDRQDAETDYLKAQTKELREEAATAANEISKVKGTDWAKAIKVKGDFRYRHEMIDQEDLDADRTRHRIRARVGVEARPTDNITAAVQLSTSQDADPRSSNQTLGSGSTRKDIYLDLAYADWKFAEGANLILGKQRWAHARPGMSLFYDNDFNPEGGALTFSRGIVFGSAWADWLSEESGGDDGAFYGGQLGVRVPFGDASNIALAATYNTVHDPGGTGILYLGSSNGNSTNEDGSLLYDFEVIEGQAELNTILGKLPLMAYVNYAQNMDPEDLNEAYSLGFLFGRASNNHTWELGAAYQSIEKDALFGQFIDSDLGGGKTDADGWVVRAGYVPVKNWILNATYFMNKIGVDRGAELDYNRVQLDLNYRF